jgi:hypothetical protein
VAPITWHMPSQDLTADELRARLDAVLTGEATLTDEDLRTLISSWELMRRALHAVPSPQLAIDSHEVPHTIWYRGDRRQALEAATDGTLLEHIDAPPAQPATSEEVVDERQRTREAARALAAHWEAHHGPLPPRRSWDA